MYTLKSIAQRGTNLGAAIALLLGVIAPAVMPAMSAYADALNPLTKRSLTLSSSSPGWDSTDGSGNSTYAPPNSGANGHQTGNTFSFDVSTDSTAGGTNAPIKTISFQYCTHSAGACIAPGDDSTHGTDTSSTADLKVNVASPLEVADSTDGATGAFTDFVSSSTGAVTTVPNRNNTQGNYLVEYYNGTNWVQSTGWKMSAVNQEETTGTGLANDILLTNSTGLGIATGTPVQIVFFGTNTNYITNPGSGAFFVKINTYNKEYKATSPGAGQVNMTGLEPASDANVIDGGVTVANVMNQSIQITTKVLETMDFSVGTVDPYTLNDTQLAASSLGQSTHAGCDRILPGMTQAQGQVGANTLQLGDQTAENSLATNRTYSTHSYWRLSSNSSGGATVYYSGSTLSNTEGDQIKAVHNGDGTSAAPTRGTEQFGLALDNGSRTDNSVAGDPAGANDGTHNYAVSYAEESDTAAGNGLYENGADNGAHGLATYGSQGVDASVATDIAAASLGSVYHTPQLYPLVPETNYDQGKGTINTGSDAHEYASGSPSTQFAFNTASQTIPAPIATENAHVVDCVTGKMRYIANIAATTPAGIYTTKVNYIAAPQY